MTQLKQLSGKVKFVIKKTPPNPYERIYTPPGFDNSPGTDPKKFNPLLEHVTENTPPAEKIDNPPDYSDKLKLARNLLLDSLLSDENGEISPVKLKLLIEHLKYKKPDVAVGMVLDLLKIEQKEQDLKIRNKNFGEKAKPPAPILIQINNPGESSSVVLTGPQNDQGDPEEFDHIEERPVLNLEEVLSDNDIEEIKKIRNPSENITELELSDIRRKVANLSPEKKKDFFSDINNQKQFLEMIQK